MNHKPLTLIFADSPNTAKPAYQLLSAFFRIHGPFQDRESPRKRVPCHNQLFHARSNTVPGSRTYAARTKPIHPVSRGRPSSAGASPPPPRHPIFFPLGTGLGFF